MNRSVTSVVRRFRNRLIQMAFCDGRTNRFHPIVELLENKVVPTVFTWAAWGPGYGL